MLNHVGSTLTQAVETMFSHKVDSWRVLSQAPKTLQNMDWLPED